jgi:putative membrane protein
MIMTENPYRRFHGNELILRDELAIDRTILANERTVLAYLRGAMTLIIVGITFVNFFETGLLHYVGLACIPFGVAVGIFGYRRYRKMGKAIRDVRRSLNQQAKEANAEQRSAGDSQPAG